MGIYIRGIGFNGKHDVFACNIYIFLYIWPCTYAAIVHEIIETNGFVIVIALVLPSFYHIHAEKKHVAGEKFMMPK